MGNKDPNYKSNGGYFFYDLNAKINHKFSEKSRLYLSSYLGKDKAYLRYKDTPDYYEDDGHKYEYTDKIGMGWESKVVNGKGWAYGVEFLIKKSLGKTSGWIGYTLSKTLRKFDELNFGRTFPAKYDCRHDVSIALTHKFNERFDIGSVWIYGSGNAVTLGIMEYSPMDYFIPRYFRDEKITEFPYRNNYRPPAYHRPDLSLNLHKKKREYVPGTLPYTMFTTGEIPSSYSGMMSILRKLIPSIRE